MKHQTASGYEQFQLRVNDLPKGERIVVLFTGSKLFETNKSWCPDCVVAEPVVDKVMESEKAQGVDGTFITCFVGNRDVWKSPDSPFRTDPKLKLTSIPTLLEYGKKEKRLTESQLTNENLVLDFLDDE